MKILILKVLNSNDIRPSTSSIQPLNTNYMHIPMSQKSGTIITRGNLQPNIENNIRIGQQQHPTIRSVIIPAGYRPMVSSQRKGVDYRLILKPVNNQLQVKNNKLLYFLLIKLNLYVNRC